ncbi:MAG: adenylate cyclase [Acetobacteraceae bacterium]|nr:adenylate cyclase [Acetobacteraceae bacterium]
MSDEKRRLAGVLAADVVGYSAMVAADEPATLSRVRALRTETIEPLAASHDGRLFKTMGDGFLLEFASAVQALRCAIAIQDALRAQTTGVRLRIGVHQGEVMPEGDDLFGDGVIVAVRLEPLAEPGGICLSSRVREDASGKMALEVIDLGEPALKNIAAKIRVYRVRLEGTSERPALPLPDKPSLVVLPFQNISGDPEQEYFADGMAEDITTALSRIRSLFVISRNSAFTYKGRAVDVRQVSRELGVRYVLEGSVRKAGSRVRITGQLIEAATGAHLWADRFDGSLEDVFELQDQVTASVIGAIEPNLRAAEIERARRKPVENLQSYDLMLRALPHIYGYTRHDLEAAGRLLRRAIEIDPSYAPGFAYLAFCQWLMVSQNYMDRSDPAVADMVQLAQTALALDDSNPEVLGMAALIIALPGGDLSGGIDLVKKAIVLNPNSAEATRIAGQMYAYAGDKQAAIAHLERAFRLNPVSQLVPFYLWYAITHFMAAEYKAAEEWAGKALRKTPNNAPSMRYRAASLGLLGRVDEGSAVVRRLLELVPDFTIARARRHIEFDMNNVFKTPGVADSLYEGLRRSGVPE